MSENFENPLTYFNKIQCTQREYVHNGNIR